MLGLFMVIPVLPLVANDIPGATPLLIGMAVGIYGFSQALLQIPLGLASDRFGRRRIIAAGLVVFVLGSLVAALGDTVLSLILGRFLQGCGAVASVLLALVSDLTRVDQRGKAMGIVGASIGGSFGLALILGPFIAAYWDLQGIFVTSAVLGVVGLVILMTLVPEPEVTSHNLNTLIEPSRMKETFTDLGLWRMNLSVFLLHFQLIAAFAVYPLLMRQTGEISDADHAVYYLALLAGSFVLMTPFMWMSDRLSDGRVLIGAMVSLMAVSMGVLVAGNSYWFVMVAMLLFFMGFNLLEVLLPASVSKLTRAGNRGTAMGLYTTCQFLGIFSGGVVSGLALELGDIDVLLLVNLCLLVGWLLLVFGMRGLGNIGSRTVALQNVGEAPAQDRANALLSVHGVLDVVVIDSEGVAYLKVDEDRFDDKDLVPALQGSGTL